MSWLIVAGFVIFFLGLMVSIGLHEIGHLVPAKIFGVRVTQYMVGFGPTMWSRRRGETEYGVKWIPLGGYIRMIGMLPPRASDDPSRLRRTSTGPWQGLIENAREAALEEVGHSDQDRVFYRKPWWQKAIIMSGGPVMNFVLAFVLFSVVMMGFGVATEKLDIAEVPKCVKTSEQFARNPDCATGDKASPAASAGLLPGDKITAIGDKRVTSWDEATRAIRAHGAGPVAVAIERGGRSLTVRADLIAQDRPNLDDPTKTDKGVGYLGVSPRIVVERQGPGYVVGQMWDMTSRTAVALSHFPQRMVGVWQAAFGGAQRGLDSPVSIVGAGRIGGEIAASKATIDDKIVMFIMLLGGFNLAIGMFNLIPLLPLDGGHIAGALWEGVKRGYARVRRRPLPGYVDIAKALPLTYAMAAVLLVMGGLLIYADVVNPIKLSG
jgi:membrane-associated protease RseP (regulator of RpoE activity)